MTAYAAEMPCDMHDNSLLRAPTSHVVISGDAEGSHEEGMLDTGLGLALYMTVLALPPTVACTSGRMGLPKAKAMIPVATQVS